MAAPSSDTFAYWVVLCEAEVVRHYDAGGITSAMSYQFDWEEQADRTGRVRAPSIEFRPVAPVQLTREGSPLPEAVELLGEPTWHSVVAPAAAHSWNPVPHNVFQHEGRRLRRLLAVAIMRARERGLGVLVAAKPGWGYDLAERPFSAGTCRLMASAGFAVLDRLGD